MAIRTSPDNWRPKGYQQFTSGFTSAQSLTVPADANLAIIQINDTTACGIRWRDDGTPPTSSVGMCLAGTIQLTHANGADANMEGHAQMTYHGNLTAFQFIEDAAHGAPATVDISYYEIR